MKFLVNVATTIITSGVLRATAAAATAAEVRTKLKTSPWI